MNMSNTYIDALRLACEEIVKETNNCPFTKYDDCFVTNPSAKCSELTVASQCWVDYFLQIAAVNFQ